MSAPMDRKCPRQSNRFEVFDLKDNQIRELCAEACGFSYRSSIFNTTERGRFIILHVAYALMPAAIRILDTPI